MKCERYELCHVTYHKKAQHPFLWANSAEPDPIARNVAFD